MPDWLPGNLAEVALFVPLRIAFLVVVAIVTRIVAHRLIDRTVAKAVQRQTTVRFRPAQALVELARDAIRDGNDAAPLSGGSATWFARRLEPS